MVTLVPVTPRNRAAFEGLAMGPHQQGLVAPVPAWLDEAFEFDAAQTFGIMDQTQAIGLASLIDTRDAPAQDKAESFQPECAYLWRFMIDHAAQGQGAGRAALAALEVRARKLDAAGLSLTTADRKPGNALGFYTALGYGPTGRRIHDEIELIKRFEEETDA